MTPPPATLVLMAKTPLPGQVKTRLIPVLGAAGAAGLADRMLRHSLVEARAARDRGQDLVVELCVAPDGDHHYWRRLAAEGGEARGIPLHVQGSGDLGQRMLAVVERVTAQGRACLLMGCDCPGLDRHQLRSAHLALADADVVVAPTRDGGYALIAMHRPHRQLFRGIPWSTPEVMERTSRLARQGNLRLHCLPQLVDIDRPTDLSALPAGWR